MHTKRLYNYLEITDYTQSIRILENVEIHSGNTYPTLHFQTTLPYPIHINSKMKPQETNTNRPFPLKQRIKYPILHKNLLNLSFPIHISSPIES